MVHDLWWPDFRSLAMLIHERRFVDFHIWDLKRFFMKPLRFEAAARVWKDREALSPINRLLREGLGGGTRAQFKGHLQLVNTEQVSAA